MTDQILTLKEVASYLKLAEKTAYKLAAEAGGLRKKILSNGSKKTRKATDRSEEHSGSSW